MPDNDAHLLTDVLQVVKSAAAAGNALALGPTAVHNLWIAIQALGGRTAGAEPSSLLRYDLDDDYGACGLVARAGGEWVRYEDAQAEIKQLQTVLRSIKVEKNVDPPGFDEVYGDSRDFWEAWAHELERRAAEGCKEQERCQ